MEIKKYDNYKDSGIEWIGEIPSHWTVGKLKFFCDKITDGSHHSPPTMEDGKRYLSVKDIGQNEINFENCKRISEEEFDLLVRNGCQPQEKDILLTKDGTIGRASIVGKDTDFVVLSSLGIIRPNKDRFNPVFLREWLVSNLNVDQMLSLIQGSALTRITITIISNLLVTLPPKDEQDYIANFLDHKTTQIDDLITQKERLIQLFEEERTAIINQAVTKGLDPNVPMKDSGIEWLGEIPKHWKVKKLKYFADVVLGKMLTNEDKGGFKLKPYLRAKNIEWINPNVDDVKEMWFSENEIIQYRVKENDLLVSEGGEVGRSCIWRNQLEECYIQNSVHKVTILEGEPNYFLNQFVLFGDYGHFDAIVNKISIAHLTKEKLKDITFIFPSIDEQSKISQFISNKTIEIENIILKFKQEIELLKEYKTALISEVVTGKVDVRDYSKN